MSANTIAAIVGSLLGAAVSIFVLGYVPMKANYDRNGCVWLQCPARAALEAEDKP